jgi:hypothetical protein
MQAESNFEWLENCPVSRKHTRPVERRVKILENTVRELRKYHTKAGKHKRSIIKRMIFHYTEVIERLS